ncbi:MAG TPA: YceI family protein [Trebonia sp.]|jgi:polyisoprenoid-binding protein YceI|nr:YceI family protein [Trebonia sp.]
MRTPSGQTTAPAVRALLEDGALAGEWVLVPRASSIRLKAKAMGLVPVRGVFGEVGGNGTVSPGGEVSGTVTVAAASVGTKNARRDAHLRSAGFSDSAGCPDITFTADGTWPSGQGVTVTGVLTVRGRTGRCPSMPRRPPWATARSGPTPGLASTGPASASPGTGWA